MEKAFRKIFKKVVDTADNLLIITTIQVVIWHSKMNPTEVKQSVHADEKSGWLEIVRRHVASLRYGVVQVVVHDSQVTQIDKTERVRLENPRAGTI